MVEVAAAEEAGVRLLLFLVLGMLRACNRGAESRERRGKCVSICGRLNEALVFVGGWRGACGMRTWVLISLLVGDCLVRRSFLFLSSL